ncbi:MAG: MATE family efflux transporter [Bacteroidales bacterium]|jgi:MATE family multidrug resistance protein|nr:MATE family efflux transporter [Bacteroidales bacterium]
MKIKQLLPYYKRNLKLAYPVMLAQLGQVTVSFADTIMVGRVGTTELAASAFANSIFIIIFIFSLGFSLGITPLIGNAFGKKQFKKISVLFQNGLLVNIILSLVLMAIFMPLAPALRWLNQPADVVEMAIPYFLILMASALPSAIFFAYRQFGEGIGNTKMAMWITFLGNVVNIFFNYILIYGKFGFPELGLIGAGIGTLIARIAMAVAFIWAVQKRSIFAPYRRYFSKDNFHKVACIRLLKTSFPISGQLLVEVLSISISAIMVGWINKENLAAHQIAMTMASGTFMLALGVASATTIRISHQFGSGHYKATKVAAIAAMHLAVILMSFNAAMFFIFRNQIPMAFSTDPVVIKLAAQLLIVAGFFQIFDGIQIVGLSALRGIADVKSAMYIATISYILICLPTAYLFGFTFHLGAVGIWIGLAIGLVIAALAYRARFNYFMKKFIKK